jgi:hypothetical protein
LEEWKTNTQAVMVVKLAVMKPASTEYRERGARIFHGQETNLA